MFQPTTKENLPYFSVFQPWHSKLPVESHSNQIAMRRRPLADLQNPCLKAHQIRAGQQAKKNEIVDNKENEKKVSKKCENVLSYFQNELEKGFKKQEINSKGLKPALYGNEESLDFIEEDENFYTNPVLINDVYFHMKEVESKNCPLFRRSESEISIKMRSSFIDWLIFTTETFKLNAETLHLAVHYADKYLSIKEAGVSDLLLVGTCAILLACKHEEIRDKIPEMNDLIAHASGVFYKQDILKMEHKMLMGLDFKMSYPTIYQFLQIFCIMYDVKGEVSFLAQYLCDIALIHEEIYFYTEPSKIAAASLTLSISLLDIQFKLGDIEILSGYSQSDLKFTAKLLFAKFDEILVTELKAVRIKYSSSKFQNVSERSYPRDISI